MKAEDVALIVQLNDPNVLRAPLVIISNDQTGATRIEVREHEDFRREYREGIYRGRPLLRYVPPQDEMGCWVGVPSNALLVIKGAIIGKVGLKNPLEA